MQYSINHGPHYATLDLILDPDEEVLAEPDLLLAMSPNLEVAWKSPGAGSRWWGSARTYTAGETPATATFRAKDDTGTLTLAPRWPGSIISLRVRPDRSYYLAPNSFFASSAAVSITSATIALRGIASRQGMYVLQASGDGEIFCASNGAIVAWDLAESESQIVDHRYLIAFSDKLSIQLAKAARELSSGSTGNGNGNPTNGPRNCLLPNTRLSHPGTALDNNHDDRSSNSFGITIFVGSFSRSRNGA